MRKIIDPKKLELLSSLDFTAPASYYHYSQLKSFKDKYEKDFYWFDILMNDEDCRGATHQIIAGKKYTAKIFKPGIEGEGEYFPDCIEYLKDTGHFYAHAQGLSLMYKFAKSFFPVGKHVWSPDEINTLPKSTEDIPQVPRMRVHENGQAEFHPYSSRTSLSVKSNMTLLVFTQREL